MVALVLLTTCLATIVASFWIARRVRAEQQAALARAATTLSEATYPLTERVLQQMQGLSGADFVLADAAGSLRAATMPTGAKLLSDLAGAAYTHDQAELAEHGGVTLAGRTYLVDRVRLKPRSPLPGGTLFILSPEDQLSSQIRQAVLPAVVSGALAALVSMVIATWLARRFASPIRTLVTQTAGISGGAFAHVPVPNRNDEFRDLAESINHMADRLAAYEQQVRQHERLQSMGQLAAAMGHQLRNTATGGRLAVELHQQLCNASHGDESLAVALRQLRLLESHVRQFLSIGNPAPIRSEKLDLAALVDETIGLLRPMYDHAGIELRVAQPEGGLEFHGERDGLRQLVMNLLLNALDAVRVPGETSPKVLVELAIADAQRGRLVVEDSGPGPAPAIQGQLFQSFVTDKLNGVGLGLYCARQIAEHHGGRLRWERREAMTRFEFEFPLSRV